MKSMKSVAILPFCTLLLGAVADTLSQEQEARIREAVKRASLPETCPENTKTPTDLELLFGHDAHLKIFSFSADKDSWFIDGVQECLEEVSGHSWLGGHANLWELSTWQAKELAKNMTKDQWDLWPGGGYIELGEMKVNDSVVMESGVETGPFRHFANPSRDLHFQEPCNAVSNAIYYRMATAVCQLGGKHPPGYDWNDALRATAAGLAFGSFAMHGNPYKKSTPPSGYVGPWAEVDTHMLDIVPGWVLNYLVYQGAIHSLINKDTADPADFQALLTMGGDAYYADARQAAQELALGLSGDMTKWNAALYYAKDRLPESLAGAVALVVVHFYAIFNEELFGPRGKEIAGLACTKVVASILPSYDPDFYCGSTSTFGAAARRVTWRAPANIAQALGKLFDIVGLKIQAMWWSESAMKPANYMSHWADIGLISATETQCFRQPHSNWHRTCAVLAIQIIESITGMIDIVLDPPLSAGQKAAAWADTPAVVSSALGLVYPLGLLTKGDELNMCNVYLQAKKCASATPFCAKPQLSPLLDVARTNELLDSMLADYATLENLIETAGPIDDPLGLDCKWNYNASLQRVSGLSNFHLSDLNVKTEYKESEDGTSVVRATVKFSTCPMAIRIEGDSWLDRSEPENGGYGSGYLCSSQRTQFLLDAAVLLDISAEASVDVSFDAIFAGESGGEAPFKADISDLSINCHDLTLLPPTDGWHHEMSFATLNSALDLGITSAACAYLGPFIKEKLKPQLQTAAAEAGQITQGALGRRMASDQCNSTVATQLKDLFGRDDFDQWLKEAADKADSSIMLSGAWQST
eukprot:CAMPEP_0197660230 /NCGR_PEP_ID=MMETSP1338-20131121/50723_1 /TAXON_ID=43686 ORGANISM="Pelagodinium beii, Strain RCC1491" /NCGR_SAMPLE_ID=MMETSP1338 /ASSEMBLY_ACC=CAM_ASM_000754 /LENGTH=812 /DNA_ID=CAMNT_0043237547 /DNA_START=19 /DNA_END=2454 /DNA_ORIENTATION=-